MTTRRRQLAPQLARAFSLIPPAALRRLPEPLRTRALLRLVWAVRTRPLDYKAAKIVGGHRVSGNTQDTVQRYLYVFGVWEPDVTSYVRQVLEPGDVVLDVGANVGYFSLVASREVGPTGAVIAFEALPSIAGQLRQHLNSNRVDNVEVIAKAVGAVPGEIEVFRSGADNVAHSGTAGGQGFVSEGMVPLVRVADVVDPALWSRVRLVKIDVEGDELRALQGMEKLLQAMPVGGSVLTEITPASLVERGQSAEELLAFMAESGFMVMRIRNDYNPRYYASWTPSLLTELGDLGELNDVVFTKVGTGVR